MVAVRHEHMQTRGHRRGNGHELPTVAALFVQGNQEYLLASLQAKVIEPAEQKAQELTKR